MRQSTGLSLTLTFPPRRERRLPLEALTDLSLLISMQMKNATATFMSPRTANTLDCSWSSKVQKLGSKVGLQKINVELPTNELVILRIIVSILYRY